MSFRWLPALVFSFGLSLTGVSAQDGQPAAPIIPTAPLPPPPLTEEQRLQRLGQRITALATRVESLRRLGGLGATPSDVPGTVPAETLEDLEKLVSRLAVDLQARARVIELAAASRAAADTTTDRAFAPPTFEAAPDRVQPRKTPTSIAAEQDPFPAFDPSRSNEVLFEVGSTPIERGVLEGMVAARKKYMPAVSNAQLAQLVLSQSLISISAVLDQLKEQVPKRMANAAELRRGILEGKLTFEEAVERYSDDPSTKIFGGLSTVNPLILSDFERTVLTSMKPGDTSHPFLSLSGVEFVRLEEVEENPENPSATIVKFRRMLLGFDFGVPIERAQGQIAAMVRDAKVKVVNPDYAQFLPPNVPRITADAAPKDGEKPPGK